jgi:cation diffusion facilitator family transporter
VDPTNRCDVLSGSDMTTQTSNRSFLTRFAWLSIAAALLTIVLKGIAYILTGSIGLLSDAIESIVNLVGALMALAMLSIAARPADEEHSYGHGKAEYFSSGVEGTLILFAAVAIAISAFHRLLTPKPLEQVGIGLTISVVASLVNLGVALVLLRAAKRYQSITLEANAHHLLTDVWTSAGVVIGVGAVALTDLERLDPIVALLVAGNIVYTGFRIVRESIFGLMDTALPAKERDAVYKALVPYEQEGIHFHAILTRKAGAHRFISLHVLVPGSWTVQQGHDLLERIEADIRNALANVNVITHLESLDDAASWDDISVNHPNVTSTSSSAHT